MALYQYKALPYKDCTRLLEILPGDEDAVLALELSDVSLNVLESGFKIYDAISYTWGENTDLRAIEINGLPSFVRPNIHNFLLRLRRLGWTTPLWLDAISIRQDDAEEKGRQVHMIGWIFRSARKVPVWVGEHASNSEVLFQDPPGPQSQQDFSLGESLKRILAWGDFIERPYWTRLWIVQEVCLAKEVIIHCGHSSASWAQLITYRFMRMGSFSGFENGELVWDGIRPNQFPAEQRSRHAFLAGELSFRNKFLMIMRIDDLRRMNHQSSWRGWILKRQAHDLGFLVNSYHTQQCSDTRDKVFALLSLVDGKMQGLRPDYTMTPAEVLVQVCLRKTTTRSQNWMAHLQSFETDEKVLFAIRITDHLLDSVQSRREALRLAASMHEQSTKSSQETRTSRLMLAAIRTVPWFDQVSDAWPGHIDLAFRYLNDHARRLRERYPYAVLYRTYL